MAIKKYSVTLDEQIVEGAKSIYNESGGKLSPLINSFLKKYIEENKSPEEEEEEEIEVKENGNSG